MSFDVSIAQALTLMPRHRESTSRRSASLGLDDLIDEARARGQLDTGALDLLLMGHRYRARALRSLKVFLKGKLPKPLELEDLFVLCFASLLSRDKMPAPVQLNIFVEVAGRIFGKHFKGILNAWGRQILREIETLEEERRSSPESWLPDSWRKRWKTEPKLLSEAARRSFGRPAAGIWAFDETLKLEKKSLSEWQAHKLFQAMDPGSWQLVEWINGALGETQTLSFLDACAAPGGKFVALALMRKEHGLKKALAADAKFGRVDRLKKNISVWQEEIGAAVETRTHAWGEDETLPAWSEESWDLVLADLPCTGSGTLHTRPDLLDRDPFDRLESLQATQARILDDLSRLGPKHLFVSICSVDPEEIKGISRILGLEPSFSSWTADSEPDREGLTAWHIAKK